MPNDTVAEHGNAVTEGVSQIFSTMCGVQLEPTDRDPTEGETGGMILAVISLVGDLEWAVFLGLPRETAEASAAKFAGFEIAFDSPDMGDAMGELTNIIVGQVKSLLDARGINVEISLPSVMRAESLEVLVQREMFQQKQCFTSSLGGLWTGVISGMMPFGG
ncbi:MAG: chemotaxis protein CheX [Phycisphaerae bacterium]